MISIVKQVYWKLYCITGKSLWKSMRFFLSDVFWAVKLEVIVFFLLSRIFLNVYNKIVLILQSEKK